MALLTPGDIRNKKIPLAGRFQQGYNLDEVDDFLEECAQTVDELGKQYATQTQSLGPDVAALNTQVSQLTGENTRLRSELSAAQEKLQQSSASSSEAESSLRSELDSANDRIKTLTGQVDQAKVQMDTVNQQNEQLKTQVDQLNDQINQLTDQAAQGSSASEALQQQLTGLRNERDEYMKRGETLTQELQNSQLAVQEANRKAEDAEHRLQEAAQR
ncbi:MAG: DivIVA domain-containing protein, partial [Scardovia wiggsiae]